MNHLLWLESWFDRQCDGRWEHGKAISIQTLDHPGWIVRIDLNGTPFRQASDLQLKQSRHAEREWMSCRVVGSVFEGAGGPLMLGPILQVFRDWVEHLV